MADTFKFNIVVDNSEAVLNELQQKMTKALTAASIQVVNYATLELDNNPRRIDTGLLKNSITYALGGEGTAIQSYRGDNPSRYKNDGVIPRGSYSGTAPADGPHERHAIVGTNVEYAIYVHEGARLPSGKMMTPNRFLKNAVQKNQEQLRQIIETMLSG